MASAFISAAEPTFVTNQTDTAIFGQTVICSASIHQKYDQTLGHRRAQLVSMSTAQIEICPRETAVATMHALVYHGPGNCSSQQCPIRRFSRPPTPSCVLMQSPSAGPICTSSKAMCQRLSRVACLATRPSARGIDGRVGAELAGRFQSRIGGWGRRRQRPQPRPSGAMVRRHT